MFQLLISKGRKYNIMTYSIAIKIVTFLWPINSNFCFDFRLAIILVKGIITAKDSIRFQSGIRI